MHQVSPRSPASAAASLAQGRAGSLRGCRSGARSPAEDVATGTRQAPHAGFAGPLFDLDAQSGRASVCSSASSAQGARSDESSEASFGHVPVIPAATRVVTARKTPVKRLTPPCPNNPDKPRFSLLESDRMIDMDDALLMGNTCSAGGFGAVRLSITQKRRTETAVKCVRTFASTLYHDDPTAYWTLMESPERHKKTALLCDVQFLAEADSTTFMRDRIEAFTKPYDDPSSADDDTLRHVRRRARPFEIHGLYATHRRESLVRKMYLVMTREDGDLNKLRSYVERENLRALLRSTTAQLFTELDALEHTQAIHADLKPSNLFFDRDGQIKIMDWGLFALVGPQGYLTVDDGGYGSLLTFEHVHSIPNEPRTHRRLTYASDVFSGALTVAHIAYGRHSPFFLGNFKNEDGFSQSHARTFLAGFSHWRSSLFSENLGAASSSDALRPPGVYGHADNTDLSATFDQFFGRFREVDAPLYDLLMRHALAPDPEARWRAGAVARRARALTASDDAPDFDGLLQDMEDCAQDNPAAAALQAQAEAHFGWTDEADETDEAMFGAV